MVLLEKDYSTSGKFIPAWYGNKNRDVATQIVINYKAPTVALSRRILDPPKLKMISGEGTVNAFESELIVDYTKVIMEMVTGIENFGYVRDGKQVDIQIAADLFREGVPVEINGLIDEVGQFLQGLLQKKAVDQKN